MTRKKTKAVWIGLILLVLPILWIVVMANTQDLYGYVNRQGQFVIPPQFYDAEDFKQGRAQVYTTVSNQSPCDQLNEFYIDSTGEQASITYGTKEDCLYSRREEHREPSANTGDSDWHLIPARNPKPYSSDYSLYYGYRYRTGSDGRFSWVISPKYARADFFVKGVAWVAISQYGDLLWGLINKKGDYILQPKCLQAGDFHDELALCQVHVYFGVFY